MPLPQIALSGVAELFRPGRVAQTILTTESYGTPVMDLFYPEARRSSWDNVLVPLAKITRITRAIPVVVRGAPGISIGSTSGSFDYMVPQPVKGYDAIAAAEYQNAVLAGPMSVQQWANDRIQFHLETHRKTAESLAAQSLTGTITYPVANPTGTVIDTYTVAYGTLGSYTVLNDWTLTATTMGEVYQDLVLIKQQQVQAGWNVDRVLCGINVMVALLDKVNGLSNDMRSVARQNPDGSIQVGEFVVTLFSAQYYHPGGVGGSPAAGYVKVVGDDNILAYDSNAPFTFLRVALDNFKLPADPGPLGIIPEVSKDGGTLEIFSESKPFPIPVAEAMVSSDVSAP